MTLFSVNSNTRNDYIFKYTFVFRDYLTITNKLIDCN